MIVFETTGVPTTTNIGQNPTTLKWQNTHKRGPFETSDRPSSFTLRILTSSLGSQLMMTVVDSNTSAKVAHVGGIADRLYSVTGTYHVYC